jgi:hypothetical protein
MSRLPTAPSNDPYVQGAPSKGQILRATLIAAAVAAVIFVTTVLPAEFGRDPLHTGVLLGLSSLSRASSGSKPAVANAPTPGVEPVVTAGTPGIKIVPGQNGDAPTILGVFAAQPAGYKVDSRVLKLAPGEGIEIKYHMQSGAGMVYSWTANENIFYEFHGEPDAKPAAAPADYFESYKKDDQVGAKEFHGTFTAPSTGIQGWFWDNESGEPITVRLVTAGFYDYILQNKNDVKTRLQPTDPR